MVQNLRAYFILYVISIKFIKCAQEKIEFAKTNVDLYQNFWRCLFGCKDKIAIKSARKFSRVAKRWHPVAQGWHFTDLMPTKLLLLILPKEYYSFQQMTRAKTG